jgi:hypothetical protein
VKIAGIVVYIHMAKLNKYKAVEAAELLMDYIIKDRMLVKRCKDTYKLMYYNAKLHHYCDIDADYILRNIYDVGDNDVNRNELTSDMPIDNVIVRLPLSKFGVIEDLKPGILLPDNSVLDTDTMKVIPADIVKHSEYNITSTNLGIEAEMPEYFGKGRILPLDWDISWKFICKRTNYSLSDKVSSSIVRGYLRDRYIPFAPNKYGVQVPDNQVKINGKNIRFFTGVGLPVEEVRAAENINACFTI